MPRPKHEQADRDAHREVGLPGSELGPPADYLFGLSLADAMSWAYFPGFAEPGAKPPDIDPAAVAQFVRVLIDETSRAAEQNAARHKAEVEITALTAAVKTAEAEIARLRGLLAAKQPADRWDNVHVEQPPEPPQPGRLF